MVDGQDGVRLGTRAHRAATGKRVFLQFSTGTCFAGLNLSKHCINFLSTHSFTSQDRPECDQGPFSPSPLRWQVVREESRLDVGMTPGREFHPV
jgi:hypothetical protein